MQFVLISQWMRMRGYFWCCAMRKDRSKIGICTSSLRSQWPKAVSIFMKLNELGPIRVKNCFLFRLENGYFPVLCPLRYFKAGTEKRQFFGSLRPRLNLCFLVISKNKLRAPQWTRLGLQVQCITWYKWVNEAAVPRQLPWYFWARFNVMSRWRLTPVMQTDAHKIFRCLLVFHPKSNEYSGTTHKFLALPIRLLFSWIRLFLSCHLLWWH